MKLRILLFYIVMSVFLFNYRTDINAGNGGRIRININPSAALSEITKIAVLPFNTNAAVNYESQGQAFADQYAEDFGQIGYYCIDNETIIKTMKDQLLNPNVPVDVDTAIRIGKLLGAEGVVLGQVIRDISKFSSHWRYLIKLVHVETGQTIWNVYASNVYKGEVANRLKEELNKNN